jgi:hypothetical protein
VAIRLHGLRRVSRGGRTRNNVLTG